MRKIVRFYGDKKENGFLSNWYMSDFKDEKGVVYCCMEQYMMYQKALLFKDPETAELIIESNAPSKIKALGRKVKNFNQDKWNENKFEIVKKGVYFKFSQNDTLKKKLLAFGKECGFAECSPYDRIWGIGISASNPDSLNPKKWQGENLLGKAIEAARDKILEENKR